MPTVCSLIFQSVVWSSLISSHHHAMKISSVQSLFDPMDCSMPGFPVLLQHPELTQTHIHRVTDAIQPSHPLSSLSPPAFNLSQRQVFSNESVLGIRWPKYWSFSFSISPSNEYLTLISFRIDWFDLLVVQGDVQLSRCCKTSTWSRSNHALL